MNRLAKTFGILSAAALVAGIGSSAVGQETGEDLFNIPDDITILGPANPNARKATAIVNGQIITGTDVDQRVALILDANNNAKPAEEELRRLKLQVLRNLIDESLQIQEAKALEMPVDQSEVDQTYQRLAGERFNRTPAAQDAYLTQIGSSANSLKRQIQGELSWDRLLRRNIQPFVNVSAGEVNELYERLQASRGTTEYRIGEIYMAATPANRTQVEQNVRQIVQQLQQGGSFVAYARQYSQASTAAVGGDLGWIQLAQLQNPQLEAVAADLQPGQLAGPIEIPGGFSVLYLIDKRQIGMADPRDAVLSLKQISLEFPAGTTEAQARTRADAFTQGVQAIRGCGDADAVATRLGAEVVTNDQVQVRALPDALQATLLELNVGQSTPPFGSLQEGVRVLMLCGRDDPENVSGPNRDQIMASIEDERVNKRAQRYLRDLRRDAVIEYN